jgi:1,4-dihydroxy-6-naphthoate synthase
MDMDITVGHTPDADDAFMFYALASGKLRSIFVIKHVIQDIEALNRRALRHELDVTAVSAHAYAHLKDYVILKSGGSFGLNYGPIVITRCLQLNWKMQQSQFLANSLQPTCS